MPQRASTPTGQMREVAAMGAAGGGNLQFSGFQVFTTTTYCSPEAIPISVAPTCNFGFACDRPADFQRVDQCISVGECLYWDMG